MMKTQRVSPFAGYLLISAGCVLLQGCPLWSLYGRYGEAVWAATAALWVWSLLPRDPRGRIFALSLALILSGLVLMLGLIQWPNYDPVKYFTRMYSSLACGAVVIGGAVVIWADERRIEWGTLIGPVWFAAVLFGGKELDWYYWTHAVVKTAIWTACLIAWLIVSPRRYQGVSSSRPPLPSGTGTLPRPQPVG